MNSLQLYQKSLEYFGFHKVIELYLENTTLEVLRTSYYTSLFSKLYAISRVVLTEEEIAKVSRFANEIRNFSEQTCPQQIP